MQRTLVSLVVAAAVLSGCSKSSPGAKSAPSSTSSALSAAELDRRVCAAYEAFWDADYSGGAPSPAMLAAEQALVTATEATPDQALHDAVRGVIAGEFGLPKFDLRETAPDYQRKLSRLPPDVRAALDSVEQNDRHVEARCDAVGRHINA